MHIYAHVYSLNNINKIERLSIYYLPNPHQPAIIPELLYNHFQNDSSSFRQLFRPWISYYKMFSNVCYKYLLHFKHYCKFYSENTCRIFVLLFSKILGLWQFFFCICSFFSPQNIFHFLSSVVCRSFGDDVSFSAVFSVVPHLVCMTMVSSLITQMGLYQY